MEFRTAGCVIVVMVVVVRGGVEEMEWRAGLGDGVACGTRRWSGVRDSEMEWRAGLNSGFEVD